MNRGIPATSPGRRKHCSLPPPFLFFSLTLWETEEGCLFYPLYATLSVVFFIFIPMPDIEHRPSIHDLPPQPQPMEAPPTKKEEHIPLDEETVDGVQHEIDKSLIIPKVDDPNDPKNWN